MPGHMQPESELHRIRAVTLDLDDTLWAIEPVIRNAEARLWSWLSRHYPRIPRTFAPGDLLELRQEVMEEEWQRSHDFRHLRKMVLTRVAAAAGYTDDLVEPAFAIFDDARNTVELYPDVLDELGWLYENYTVVAVTNGNSNLEKIGIRHLFHGVVTAVDAGAAKPARPIFDISVEAAGVAAEEILHVGDHPETDIDGARQAGFRTAWINRNGDDWPDSLAGPDTIVATLSELREWLESARKAT